VINFANPVRVNRVELKFQGGFCSSQFVLEKLNQNNIEKSAFEKISEFYPEDINSTQVNLRNSYIEAKYYLIVL
jgi:hypothetical protein